MGKEQSRREGQPGAELGAGRGLEEGSVLVCPLLKLTRGTHRALAVFTYYSADAVTEPYPLSGRLEMSFPE